MKKILTLLLIGFSIPGYSQDRSYSNSNAHSHNDYRNSTPFYRAYHQGFGSIEADIYPLKGELAVAHDKKDLDLNVTLTKLYLDPINKVLSKDPKRKLQLLVDIKENYLEVLPLLIRQLQPLRSLLSTSAKEKQLRIVISGTRPKPADFHNYPDYIFFDHDLSSNLTTDQAKRVGLVSVPFTKFSKWNGLEALTSADKERVKAVIDSAHRLKKQIRFWAAPDTKTSWLTQMSLGADLIGTDKIDELGSLLKNLSKRSYRQNRLRRIEKQTSSIIRVMAYNVHHCNPPAEPGIINIKAIAEVIAQQNPDLVALQEIDVNTKRSGKPNQAEELAKLTGMKYFFGKAIDYEGGEYGVAVLSKYDISDMKVHRLPTQEGTKGEPRVLTTAKINFPGAVIRFGSTHLDAQKADTNRKLQIQEINRIVSEEKLPFIIAGDFNDVPGSAVINDLDKQFTRTCQACDPTIPIVNPKKAIDFIGFTPSSKFEVVQTKVLNGVTASDHLPVVAEVRLMR